MSKRNVFLYETSRTLLIYLLYTDNLNGRNIYITTKAGVDDIFKRLIGPKIVLKGDLSNKKNQRRYNSYYKRTGWLIFRKLRKRIKRGEVGLYGLAHMFLGGCVFSVDNFNLIEDGLRDIQTRCSSRKNIIYKINLWLNRVIRRNRYWWVGKYGADPNIKNIIMTSGVYSRNKKSVKYNTIILDLDDAWNKKSEAEKEYICNVFSVDLEYVKNIDQNAYWLYTQPLSEDDLMSEEEKIEIYSKIIGKYDRKSIVIKPHPRETTDYKKIFPDIKVLDISYPMELLLFLGVKPVKVITIFSTAVFLLNDNISIDFYGTEIHQSLYNKFGSMDKIFTRNVFL